MWKVVIPTIHTLQESVLIKVDVHWRPFTFHCSYCDINYDLIGRMETWNDDLNYIIRNRGLEKDLKVSADKNPSTLSTKEMTREYFDTLSKKQKEDLYHMFRVDFEMFNSFRNV